MKRKNENSASVKRNYSPQKYRYIAVLDFEATCEKNQRINPQEIIEFPVMLVDTSLNQVVATFHEYVRPIHNPKLSKFCTELTGITQQMVTKHITKLKDKNGQTMIKDVQAFPYVWKQFTTWCDQHKLTTNNCIFLICGDWDFKFMLPGQLRTSNIQDNSKLFRTWINIKK
eukprot:UN33437